MRKGEARRRAILEVAEKLFYTKGYEETSVQDILDVLDTSKGCFYHHFESKEQVLETLCAERAARSAAECERQLEQLSSPLERLQCTLHALMPLRTEEERFLRVMLPLLLRPEGQLIRLSFQDALAESFTPILRRAIDAGRAAGVLFAPDNEEMPGLVCELSSHLWYRAVQTCLRCHLDQTALEAGPLIDLLELHRFAVERLLDVPYGALEILRLEELTAVLQPLLRELEMPMGR